MIAVRSPRFQLGQVVATPGAVEALAKAQTSAWELLSRHVSGDFGEVDAEDRQANLDAIRDDARILSVACGHLSEAQRSRAMADADTVRPASSLV